MREVNNNTAQGTGNVNFQNVQPRKEDVKPEVQVETQETTDLSKMPSEVIGRSQVTNSDKDISYALKHPEMIEKINYLCDRLMARGYTYEQACSIASAMAEELISH